MYKWSFSYKWFAKPWQVAGKILAIVKGIRYSDNDDVYAVQQDTQNVLMSEFIHHLC